MQSMRSLVRAIIAIGVLAFPGALLAEETRLLAPAFTVPLDSRVEVRALPPPSVSGLPGDAPTRIRPRLVPDPDALREWKEHLRQVPGAVAPAPDTIADPRSSAVPAPRALFVVSAFEGPSNDDNSALIGFRVIPPDPNIGAGPNHVFQTVNSVGKISNKAGTVLTAFTLRSFFALDPNADETDPRVLYDAPSGRWFATYSQSTRSGLSGTSSIVLAVSTSNDPTGSFCRYRLGNPTSETFLQDFPQLGVSDDKVVVAYDGFSFQGGGNIGGGYYVLHKADLAACAPSPRVVRVPPDPSRFTEFPAQSLSSTSTLFLAMASGGSLSVFAVNGLPGVVDVTETHANLPIRPWNVPPNAQQPGSGVLLDTGPDTVGTAAWRGNSLWVAGNEACTPSGDATTRSCVRLLEVRTDTMSVRQDMTFSTAGAHYYYPAVAADAAGNISMVFTSSSVSEFASARVSGRYSGSPLNTLQPSIVVRAGGGAQTAASGRMGDYSGAAVDPVDPLSVWTMGEYIRSPGSNNWGTYVGQLRFDSPTLAAAVLPSSRSVQVPTAATAFAAIINAGSTTALQVGIALNASIPATFSYQTTDPATNAVTGTPNTPVDIPPGQSQTYVIAITPTAPFPPTDVALVFTGSNTSPATLLIGVDSLLLSASSGPVADLIALGATPSHDGIVNVPGATGAAAFAVASVNVGAVASIIVSADTGGTPVPVSLALCQTNPANGQCLSPPQPATALQINAGATPTFSIFATGTGTIPFDPALNRIFVRFKDAGGATRGSTSVAVRTQ